MAFVSSVGAPIGSLNNDDGDVNKNSNKAIGLMIKTTALHLHHAF